MRIVKWIFVVLLLGSLTSFVSFGGKENSAGKLNVGNAAPNFEIKTALEKRLFTLNDLKGKYVLLSFWATYDAQSRMKNISLNNALQSTFLNVEMISVSFDEYESVFIETIRKDRIAPTVCFVETDGVKSNLFEKYRLKSGFTNYLLNEDGIILAKDISAKDLGSLLK
ncbi:Thiol-disulfide oxidoreductase ResA [termite gut metagenome]|uniref:Thiol-disulfide oxidoreductase ResA n=1 Tax=termite gut metagenome TaxID=433724 RepID=A0A5J4RN53_9ZZZZ